MCHLTPGHRLRRGRTQPRHPSPMPPDEAAVLQVKRRQQDLRCVPNLTVARRVCQPCLGFWLRQKYLICGSSAGSGRCDSGTVTGWEHTTNVIATGRNWHFVFQNANGPDAMGPRAQECGLPLDLEGECQCDIEGRIDRGTGNGRHHGF